MFWFYLLVELSNRVSALESLNIVIAFFPCSLYLFFSHCVLEKLMVLFPLLLVGLVSSSPCDPSRSFWHPLCECLASIIGHVMAAHFLCGCSDEEIAFTKNRAPWRSASHWLHCQVKRCVGCFFFLIISPQMSFPSHGIAWASPLHADGCKSLVGVFEAKFAGILFSNIIIPFRTPMLQFVSSSHISFRYPDVVTYGVKNSS